MPTSIKKHHPFTNRSNPKGKKATSHRIKSITGQWHNLQRPIRKKDWNKKTQLKPYWINCVPLLSALRPYSEFQLNRWLLVLAAKKIPHILLPANPSCILIPPLYGNIATHETTAFENEHPHHLLPRQPHTNYNTLLILFSCIIYWHGLKAGWFTLPHFIEQHFPPTAMWNKHFGADAYRIMHRGEWWRNVTALFLHADASHLFANMGMGLLFFIPLIRRIGGYLGIFLPIIAGVAGNLLNAWYSPASHVGIGFSTALFAAVGILTVCAYQDGAQGFATQSNRIKNLRIPLVYLAAGLAILALFGSGGGEENSKTDLLAHLFGFIAGMAAGFTILPLERVAYQLSRPMQHFWNISLITITTALILWAWQAGVASIAP